MKKYFTILLLSLFTIAASAQKKNKRQKTPPPPKKEVLLPPPIQESNSPDNNIDYQIVMPANAATRIVATQMNGQEIKIDDLAEIENIDLSQLKKITFRTMVSNKSLDDTLLQKIINQAPQLEVLEIGGFAIGTFPEITTINHHLKSLSLDQNNLKTLPLSISNLVALEYFSSNNPLQELPDTFSQLKNLKELSLNATEFSEFPKAIFGLHKLAVLYISGRGTAKIKELPDSFQQLPELREFGITNASLSTLPKSIGTLKKLEKVSLGSNQFTDFPEVLASNPKLEYVPFNDNPLEWDKFIVSIKKIKWRGLFFLNETGFTKKQYEEIQKILTKIDVYYDGMND